MFDLNAIVNAAIATAVENKIAELKRQHIAELDAMEKRIAALENNPAQGVDVGPCADAALVQTVVGQELNRVKERLAGLEEREERDMDAVREIAREVANEVAESVVEEHCCTYDHDDYDNAVGAINDADLDNLVTKDSMRSEIEDVVNNASISISI